MNRTNLLQELTNTNGTFVQFQNYADDLCKQLANFEGWRVVPTKYMLVNIPESVATGDEFDTCASTNSQLSLTKFEGSVETSNTNIMECFQNYFENSVAFAKENMSQFERMSQLNLENNGVSFSDEVVKSLFWQTLERYGLLGKTNKVDSNITFENVPYIGDINVVSSKDYAGQTNTEIYVYVPEDAARHHYSFYSDELPMLVAKYADGTDRADFVYGWDEGTMPQNTTLSTAPLLSKVVSKDEPLAESGESVLVGGLTTVLPCFDYDDENYYTRTAATMSDTSFEFNAIVLFYDVEYNADGVITKKHIGVPMGIYFLGTTNAEGEFSNKIKKFVSNDDIFGQGTAYSVRLCTKFMSIPNINKLTITAETGDDSLDDNTALCAEFAKTHDAINKLINSERAIRTTLEDEFARFKNCRTNVPYVKRVGDHREWFVNGKAMGVIIWDDEYIKILEERIKKQGETIEGLTGDIIKIKEMLNWDFENQ